MPRSIEEQTVSEAEVPATPGVFSRMQEHTHTCTHTPQHPEKNGSCTSTVFTPVLSSDPDVPRTPSICIRMLMIMLTRLTSSTTSKNAKASANPCHPIPPNPPTPSRSTTTDHSGQRRRNLRLIVRFLPFPRRRQTYRVVGRKGEPHNLHLGQFAEPVTLFDRLDAVIKLRLQVEGKVFSFSKKLQGKNHNLFFLLYIKNSQQFPRKHDGNKRY